MLARRQRPHAARLLFLGASMALLGLGLSVGIVMLRYPAHKEVCSAWAGPGIFEPKLRDTERSAFIEPIHAAQLRGLSPTRIFESAKADNEIDPVTAGGLADALGKSDDSRYSVKQWNEAINEKIPFIPIIPFGATNAFDAKGIAQWISLNKCLPVSPYDVQSTDVRSQKVVKRMTSRGTMKVYCCTETRLELYFPPTISESIRNWSAPEGRIFFGFIIIAAFLVLLSSHPYTLSNVCSAHDSLFGFVNTAWLRHYFPPIGLLLVACVPTVPIDVVSGLTPAIDDVAVDLIMFAIHMCGAIGSFFGYAIAEIWALNILPDWIDSLDDEIQDTSDVVFHKQLHHGSQRFFRIIAVLIIIGGCFFFTIGFTVIMFVGVQSVIPVNDTVITAFQLITYFSEAAAAAGLGLSLLIIWYFCPERFVATPIERDFFVLEKFVAYLEGIEGMVGSLADVLKLPPGPLRTKVQELEAAAYREFGKIRQQQYREIFDDGPQTPPPEIHPRRSRWLEGGSLEETDPEKGSIVLFDDDARKAGGDEVIDFTQGHFFGRRLAKNPLGRRGKLPKKKRPLWEAELEPLAV